jgi:protein-tyrosine phosphatase
MGQLVDIHSHVLPEIDEGPPSLEGALEMARAAARSGVGVLAATPHLRSDFPEVNVREIAGRTAALQSALDTFELGLKLVSGAEVSIVWALNASDEELALATYGGRGTDLLVETPDDVTMLGQMLYRLRTRVRRLTLAHPERSPAFQAEPERLSALSDQGVLLQVNAGGIARSSQESAPTACRAPMPDRACRGSRLRRPPGRRVAPG